MHIHRTAGPGLAPGDSQWSQTRQPSPQTVVRVNDSGSYFQHGVVFRGWGRCCHLLQHSLALQRNGIYGGQEGCHDLWKLERNEQRPVKPRGRQALGSCPGNGVEEGGIPMAHNHPEETSSPSGLVSALPRCPTYVGDACCIAGMSNDPSHLSAGV